MVPIHGTRCPWGALIPDYTAFDVIIKDDVALVGLSNSTELVDLKDPSHPTLIGIVDGVGGRLTLNGFLFGTSGTTGSGLHVAALGALAYVKSFDPKLIVVSASNEVFSNTTINYAIIPPDPQIRNAEVHIDIAGGSRAATLPGPVSAGKGSVVWPSGTIVDPSRNYFATVHAQANGAELPTVATRVPLLKVPIAVVPRDRMLRIQFALPDQNAFTDAAGNPIDKYTVQVFLNADGSGSPAFKVTSDDIARAYPNTDVWFTNPQDGSTLQDGTAVAAQQWVTRKIDQIANGAGLIFPVKMQAFEIGTVLSGYSSVFVAVVSETSGKIIAKLAATASADNNWAQIVDKVAVRVDQSSTPTASGGMLNNGGLIFRILHVLDQASQSFALELLKGAFEGFKDGADGDIQMVGSVFDAVLHPVKTAIGLADFFGKVLKALGQIDLRQMLHGLFSGVGNISWPTLDDVTLFASSAGYYLGYLVGFIVEQVLSAFILALATAGIGALAEKVITVLRGIDWIASLAREVAAALRVVGYWFEVLAKAGADSAITKAVVGFVKDSKTALAGLMDKYPGADKVIKKLAETWQLSSTLATKAFDWLNVVNKMSSEAAERFVTFINNKGETIADQLMGRWLNLPNGKQAVKDAAEAYDQFATLSAPAADGLTTAVERVDTGAINYGKGYTDKYRAASDGNRVESSLRRLRPLVGDTSYTDEAIGNAVKRNADSLVVEMSDDAIEETAAIETHVPCTLVASLALAVVVPKPCGKTLLDDWYEIFGKDSTLGPRFKAGLEKLKALRDPDLEGAFANLASAAQVDPAIKEALLRAISIDGFSAQGTAEWVKAMNNMRDADGNIITGLMDASPTSGATINIKRVGNQGAGSIDEAYEAVAAERMVNDGDLLRSNIQEFGRKINVSDLGVGRSTIEADCFLKDGTFMDMKHSALNDPFIDRGQLDAVTAALENGRINKAIYVVSSELDAATLQKIADANAVLDQALGRAPGSPPLITRIIKGPPLQ